MRFRHRAPKKVQHRTPLSWSGMKRSQSWKLSTSGKLEGRGRRIWGVAHWVVSIRRLDRDYLPAEKEKTEFSQQPREKDQWKNTKVARLARRATPPPASASGRLVDKEKQIRDRNKSVSKKQKRKTKASVWVESQRFGGKYKTKHSHVINNNNNNNINENSNNKKNKHVFIIIPVITTLTVTIAIIIILIIIAIIRIIKIL